jgi:hypothetical protein
MRDREREPRLADAASAGQGDEPMRGGEAQNLAQVVFPADQLGNRLRLIRRDQNGSRHRGARIDALVRARRQKADLARELVTASGDRADQGALRSEGGAQRRNVRLQIVFLDDPVGPHARHQRVLADDGSPRLDQRHQHVEAAAAELDRSAVGEQLATMRQHLKTSEREVPRCFGGGFIDRHYSDASGNFRG